MFKLERTITDPHGNVGTMTVIFDNDGVVLSKEVNQELPTQIQLTHDEAEVIFDLMSLARTANKTN